MQEGWKRRREMEAEIGRRALRRARRLDPPPRSVRECQSEEERISYAVSIASRDDSVAELQELAEESDVVAFALRAAREEETSPDVHPSRT